MYFNYGIDHLDAGKALKLVRSQLKGIINRDASEKIRQCALNVKTITGGTKAVYGINTGFGPLCTTAIPTSELSHLQHNLLLSHSVGVGDPLDDEMVRLMLCLKIHSLSLGYSGIRLVVLERLMWMLDHNIISYVPCQGSVGASGDLAPLAHLFLPLIGEGKVKYQSRWVDSMDVLNEFNLKPLQLAPKEGLALINGTQFILAHAVRVIESFHHLLTYTDFSAAMMIEGLKGSSAPFAPELHKLRPFKGNLHVAHRLYYLIHGSEINNSHKGCNKVQDPYSLRCVPQVHGSSRDVWLHLKDRVEVELNSVTDNPIIFGDGTTISGGNFHGQPLAMSLDYASLAMSELGNIADRRIYLSMMGLSTGVPKLLLKETGVNSGFMIVQYTSAALASENKSLCYPASADSIPTSMGQEDHVSMGSISGRKSIQIASNSTKILAIELLCASQAIEFARPLKPHPILLGLYQLIRERITFAIKDRNFGNDIGTMIEMIDQSILINYIKNKTIHNEDFRTAYQDLFEVY